MNRRPRILLTPGEPAGVGPDLALELAAARVDADLLLLADPDLLAQRARLLEREISIRICPTASHDWSCKPGQLAVHPVAMRAPCSAGVPDPANAAYVVETLSLAADACLEGQADALVTGPVHKGVINDAGIAFSGHTEFLAGRVGGYPVMMLATKNLRVALATTHLPLSQVPASITPELLERVLRILHEDLRKRFGIADATIAVAGLNPHAGEGGHLGREEIDVMNPVLERLRATGMRLLGPMPADTLFSGKQLDEVDAVLAMYHDQGLPVLKYSGFGNAVNITLGLPIVRTSVDHGTALDLAGSGRASATSLECAVEMAIRLVRGA